MGRRQNVIARSITHAILHKPAAGVGVLAKIPTFFYLYWIVFTCLREDSFKSLRESVWQIDEDYYEEAFGSKDEKNTKLKAMGMAELQKAAKTYRS